MLKLTQCIKCLHITSVGKCLAYPKRIPYKVFSEQIPHNQVFDDQTGDYVYTPKQKYIEYDLMLKKEHIISESDLENLKAKIAQLYYNELSSRGFIEENWKTAKIDFEFHLTRHGGKFNELSIDVGGNEMSINRLVSYELIKKIIYLLNIKASQLDCSRLVLTIFPKSPALFEFCSRNENPDF